MKANSNNEVRKNKESEREGRNGDNKSYKGIRQNEGEIMKNLLPTLYNQTSNAQRLFLSIKCCKL